MLTIFGLEKGLDGESGDNFTIHIWSVVGSGPVFRIEVEPINALMKVDLPELNSPATTAEKNEEEAENEERSANDDERCDDDKAAEVSDDDGDDTLSVFFSIVFLSWRWDALDKRSSDEVRIAVWGEVIRLLYWDNRRTGDPESFIILITAHKLGKKAQTTLVN